MLQESDITYTFQRAVEIAQSIETMEQKLLDLKNECATTAKVTSHMVKTPNHPIVCYRCGGSHLANHCCFIEAMCHVHVWKKRHIAKVCHSKTTKNVSIY